VLRVQYLPGHAFRVVSIPMGGQMSVKSLNGSSVNQREVSFGDGEAVEDPAGPPVQKVTAVNALTQSTVISTFCCNCMAFADLRTSLRRA
jgi:hypothetical protein